MASVPGQKLRKSADSELQKPVSAHGTEIRDYATRTASSFLAATSFLRSSWSAESIEDICDTSRKLLFLMALQDFSSTLQDVSVHLPAVQGGSSKIRVGRGVYVVLLPGPAHSNDRKQGDGTGSGLGEPSSA